MNTSSLIASTSIIQPASTHEMIIKHICDGLLNGKYEPGEKLIDKKICDELEISRTPLREAYRVLQTMGLVEFIAQRGVRIVELTNKEMRDLWSLRIALERLGAVNAVKNITPADLKHLHYLVGYMDTLTSEDVNELNDMNREFHWTIVKASNNGFLFDDYKRVWLQIATLTTKLHLIENQPHNCNCEHKRILKCIEEKECEQLEKLIVSHLEDAWAVLEEKRNKDSI